ncbi:MAG TPA: nucleotide exchange factor GrpE [Dehalococcoidales bacterium]|nr:nucleotide exchange factor GrpE [Dehalococcoidales bacterium]
MVEKNEKLNEEPVPEESASEEAGLEQALAEEKKKSEEYLNSWKRTQADFINFKRRAEQDRLEFSKFACAGAFTAILPVLDDLQRAIAAIPPDVADKDWAKGVKLLEKKFLSTLEMQGVKPILALGLQFDPNFHEGIRQDKGPEGVVVQELQKGYTLNGKLLRASKVSVGTGEGEDEARKPG